MITPSSISPFLAFASEMYFFVPFVSRFSFLFTKESGHIHVGIDIDIDMDRKTVSSVWGAYLGSEVASSDLLDQITYDLSV